MKGKIFNAQEVQAIIAGSKAMFREVIKPQPLPFLNDNDYLEFLAPYQVGQKIFCKESFGFEANGYGEFFVYKSDNPAAIYAKTTLSKEVPVKWKPAQHMKQEHSRLTLLIKEIKVERLGEISEEDAFREGVQRTDEWTGCADDLDFTDAFKFNWNATHKKPEEKFEANPWVWVVSFEVINN